jgi:hypothetical protein
MAVQDNVDVGVFFKVESTYGVAAGASGASTLRRISSSLALNRDSFVSNEVRTDRQVNDLRMGMRSGRGSVDCELANASFDALLEAALGGTWATGVSVAPADFATGVTPANNGATGTFTFAGAGNLITKGFKVGDIVRATGMTVTANNGVNYRITALTSTVMTVTPSPTAGTQQAAGWAVTVTGSKLQVGNTARSFTFEQLYSSAAFSEQFLGTRVNGFNLNVQPQAMTTIGFDLMAKDVQILTGGNTPYFSSPAAAGTTGALSGLDGFVRFNGEEQLVVTGLQLNVTNNMALAPGIGTALAASSTRGKTIATGSLSVFVEDADIINALSNETEVDLVAVLEAAGPDPQEFMSFRLMRSKITSVGKTIGAEGGVLAQVAFQGLLKPGGSGTTADQSTLVIQRSN